MKSVSAPGWIQSKSVNSLSFFSTFFAFLCHNNCFLCSGIWMGGVIFSFVAMDSRRVDQ